MNPKLEKIALAGSWVDRDSDSTMGKEMKSDAIGEREKYVFYCPYCDKEFFTEKDYRVTDNYVTDSVKTGIFFRISEFFWDLFENIPVLGYYMRKRADDRLERVEDKMEDKKDRKVLLKAFEEVKDSFIRCSRCGNYTCTECMQEGVCGFCRDGTSAGDGNVQAKSEMGTEFDKQIQDVETMYAQMIEQNPDQRAALEKQKEEQKQQILAAKKNAMENVDKEDDDDF